MAERKNPWPPPGEGPFSGGQPFFQPHMPGTPGPHFPPQAAMTPPPPVPQDLAPGFPNMAVDTSRSLYQSIGNMLRLGVDVANASLMGGLQIMEGLTGQASAHHGYGGHGYPHHYPDHGYHGCYDCCSYEYHGCGCHHENSYHGCNPGVFNCC